MNTDQKSEAMWGWGHEYYGVDRKLSRNSLKTELFGRDGISRRGGVQL